MPLTLTDAEQLQIRQAAVRLQREFAGQVNTETIERLMYESTDQLVDSGRNSMWIPLLAERITKDRLRALTRLESTDPNQIPSVLFLCVHNAGRSQMAAGWMRHLADGRIDVFSGGSEPGDALNEAAVAAMAEVDIDISVEIPQPWSDEVVRASDVVVSMGCGDACPVFPGKRYVDWELDDPSGRPIDEVRVIRDDIKGRVLNLMEELKVDARV